MTAAGLAPRRCRRRHAPGRLPGTIRQGIESGKRQPAADATGRGSPAGEIPATGTSAGMDAEREGNHAAGRALPSPMALHTGSGARALLPGPWEPPPTALPRSR